MVTSTPKKATKTEDGPAFYESWDLMCHLCCSDDVDFFVKKKSCDCPAIECIACNLRWRWINPLCPTCRQRVPVITKREVDEFGREEPWLSRSKERLARDTWAACYEGLGGAEIIQRYTGREEVDAFDAIDILAQPTGFAILFMDQYAAGAIHVCRKLGWEYAKAHLNLYQHIARGWQEEVSRQTVRRALQEGEDRWRGWMEQQQERWSRPESDSNDDWSVQGDWEVRWLGAGPIFGPVVPVVEMGLLT